MVQNPARSWRSGITGEFHVRPFRLAVPALLVAGLALSMSACVSAPGTTLQSAAEEETPALPDDPPLLTLALESTAAEASAGMDSASQAEAIENGLVEAASIVPQRAPRDGASAQLQQGNVMAFAGEDTDRDGQPANPQQYANLATKAAPEPLQQAASSHLSDERRSEARASGESSAPRPAAVKQEQPGSQFESLYAGRQQKRSSGQTTGSVNTNTDRATPSPNRAAVAALPGVKSGNELFDLHGEEDHEAHGEPLQLASVSGMARMSPSGIVTQIDKVEVGCFKPELVAILKHVENHYGRPAIVSSGYRSPKANRRAGGARRSLHMGCMAADIQVEGISKWSLAKYLRTVPGRGGVGTYCRTESVHIDIGGEREWHHPCRRKKSSRKS